ncbi:MAG: secretin and TonB N-terminal domain-containing protein, partial [Bdellovibrionaceae bacterium]|nr:secretin and TonB N-terminal domain-containing protein [Pseudobdellovibrionaceae bacterium]
MKGFIRLMILGAFVLNLLSCASRQSEEEDSLTTQSYNGSEDSGAAASSGGAKDEFSDFGNDAAAASTGDTATAPEAPPSAAAGGDADLSLENEVNQASGADQQFGQDDLDKQAKSELQPETPIAENSPVADSLPDAPMAQAETPAPTIDESITSTENVPAPDVPAATEKPIEITGLKYKANDSGGTVVIESTAPVTYTTRANPELKQYVIEISNSLLPKKLKRTLNTRDIKGAVGAVDAYQANGSQVARIVVQMRDGFPEPTIQQEGNSLLVITSAGESMNVATQKSKGEGSDLSEPASDLTQGAADGNVDLNSNNILASQSLQEFLSGNTKFYGRKISIETSNIDVRDALKFITDESGVNMVITDEVKGNISLKLRQVPWDQALVMIMKARKLGYSRQGNVLRIVPLEDLKKEEDDANKMALARRNIEPLKVRAFTI